MQATVNRLAHLLPDLFMLDMCLYGASQVALVVKNPPANAGDIRDMGSVPGLGRSPGRGHDITDNFITSFLFCFSVV